jgi:hypothetical protein
MRSLHVRGPLCYGKGCRCELAASWAGACVRACPVYVSVCLGVLLGRLRFSALCVVQCSGVIGLPLAIAAVVGYTHWHKLHAVARNQVVSLSIRA